MSLVAPDFRWIWGWCWGGQKQTETKQLNDDRCFRQVRRGRARRLCNGVVAERLAQRPARPGPAGQLGNRLSPQQTRSGQVQRVQTRLVQSGLYFPHDLPAILGVIQFYWIRMDLNGRIFGVSILNWSRHIHSSLYFPHSLLWYT